MTNASQHRPKLYPSVDDISGRVNFILDVLRNDSRRPIMIQSTVNKEENYPKCLYAADCVAFRLFQYGYSVEVLDSFTGIITLVITENLQ